MSVSLCLITRQDPHLEQLLASIAPHVDEICIVVNDSNDQLTLDIAKRYNAKVEVFLDCNDSEGRIADFSMARNRSLDMATKDWILWADSDDIIEGAASLRGLIKEIDDRSMVLFPYEYAYSAEGHVLCRHYRERVWKRGACRFVNPVHEVAVPVEATKSISVVCDNIVWKHQRQQIAKPAEAQRNLRILKTHVENHPEDVRNKYYIGLEYSNAGDFDNAVRYLTEYVEVSGWSDERIMACLKLVEIFETKGDYKKALSWSFKAVEIDDWFECLYAVTRCFYHLKNWQRCVHYGQLALSRPQTKTFLFVNEADRFVIHRYYNVALNNVGRVDEALASCEEGLKGLASDPMLLNNRQLYRQFLKIEDAKPVAEPLNKDCLKICFVAGLSYERWDPDSVKSTGIGGSETMLIAQAANLARLGHSVTVYGSPKTRAGETFDGVLYKDISSFGNLACDVLVVSRYAQYLDKSFNVEARLTLLWLHDVAAINATNSLLLRADRILCLSEWHRQNVLAVHNLAPDHVIVTRNGIDLAAFENRPQKKPLRAINSSSPDRSWPVLLEVWPKIRQQVPEAELHLFYGFSNWKKIAANDPLQMDLINRLEHAATNTEGVVYHGRVSGEQLTKEFCQSKVWLYPTWFTETSCISAMQSQAAGTAVVTSSIAALKETVLPSPCNVLINGDWTSEAYQQQFIEAAVKALRGEDAVVPANLEDRFGLTSLAKEWNAMFLDLLEKKKRHPLPSYQPTKHYQQKRKSKMIKLNIACGPNVFPHDGWINCDHFDFTEYFAYVSNPLVPLEPMPGHQQRLANFLRDGGDFQFKRYSMTDPLPYADSSVDFIYVGQAIEHLNFVNQAPAFLQECRRVLKPGGILRMTTPDICKLIAAYNEGRMSEFEKDQPAIYKDLDPTAQLSLIMFGAAGEGCTQEKYEGHFFNYSEKSMKDLLEKVGFKDVEFVASKQGKNKEIAMEIVDEGISHSLIVEAVK